MPDPQAAIHYIQAKQEAHGAFSLGWAKFYRDVPDVWATLAALRSLALLGAAPKDPDACIRAMQRWQHPDGGFDDLLAVTPEVVLMGNAWKTGATLVAFNLLGGRPLDSEACRMRLAHLWSPEEGGFKIGSHPEFRAQMPATYWAVLGMAAFGLLGPGRPHWREMFLFSYR